MNVLTYGGVETAQYPLSIYDVAFRRLFTFVIPLGCIGYFPIVAVLGVDDPLGTGRVFKRWRRWPVSRFWAWRCSLGRLAYGGIRPREAESAVPRDAQGVDPLPAAELC